MIIAFYSIKVSIVYKTCVSIIDIRLLRSVHWANAWVKAVAIVRTIRTMRDHHLVAVAFVIHVISIAGEKAASIIIIDARLWLAAASPGIRNVCENTRGLLIKIK